MKADQERVSKLLTDTVTLLCKNGLVYSQDVKIQGLLGITLDSKDIFIVQISETIDGPTSSVSGVANSEHVQQQRRVPTTAGYVDLTRVTDTPLVGVSGQTQTFPSPLSSVSHAGMPVPNSVSGMRKQRQVHSQQVPASAMVGTNTHGLVSPSPQIMQRPTTYAQQQLQQVRRGLPHMPPSYGNRFPSSPSYMGRAQQQAVHGPPLPPPPIRMSRLVRQRGTGRQPPVPIAATVAAAAAAAAVTATIDDDDDDEDVVIVGTGREEPSPNWNTPNRRQNLPSQLNSPSVPRRSTSRLGSEGVFQCPSGSLSNEGSQSVQRGVIEVTGANELTSEAGRAVGRTTCDISNVSAVIVQPIDDDYCRTDQNTVAYDVGSSIVSNQSRVDYHKAVVSSTAASEAQNSVHSVQEKSDEDVSRMAAVRSKGASKKSSTEQPMIYTDNAESSCDMGAIENPGFDVLTSEENECEKWTCRFAGCVVSFSSAGQLAAHCASSHGVSDEFNISTSQSNDIPPKSPSLNRRKRPATESQPSDESSSSSSSAAKVTATEANANLGGLRCPITSCPTLYSSSTLFSNHQEVVRHIQDCHGASTSGSGSHDVANVQVIQSVFKEEVLQ